MFLVTFVFERGRQDTRKKRCFKLRERREVAVIGVGIRHLE